MKVAIALLLSLLLLAPTGAVAGGSGNGNGNGNGNGQSNGNSGNGAANNGHGGGSGEGRESIDSSSPLAPGVDDQNAALMALQSGAALPLSQIIPLASRQWGGKVIDATLVRAQDVLLYRLTIIDDQGVSRRVYCDARSGNPVNP